jgi:hypothetical protein
MAAAASQRERSPSASTQSQQPPQEEGAALHEGTTWPTREVLAQRLAICCQRVAQDGRIPVRGLRYGVWRYRDADPRHPHGFLTTLHQSWSRFCGSWVRCRSARHEERWTALPLRPSLASAASPLPSSPTGSASRSPSPRLAAHSPPHCRISASSSLRARVHLLGVPPRPAVVLRVSPRLAQHPPAGLHHHRQPRQ